MSRARDNSHFLGYVFILPEAEILYRPFTSIQFMI